MSDTDTPDDGRDKLRADIDASDKRIATLKARAALAGWPVHITGEGPRFTFVRWGMSLDRVGYDAAEQFVTLWEH